MIALLATILFSFIMWLVPIATVAPLVPNKTFDAARSFDSLETEIRNSCDRFLDCRDLHSSKRLTCSARRPLGDLVEESSANFKHDYVRIRTFSSSQNSTRERDLESLQEPEFPSIG